MNRYLVIIGILTLYIIYLRFQLWLAKQRLTIVVSNGNPKALESGGCGTLLLISLLIAIVLYLILSATQ